MKVEIQVTAAQRAEFLKLAGSVVEIAGERVSFSEWHAEGKNRVYVNFPRVNSRKDADYLDIDDEEVNLLNLNETNGRNLLAFLDQKIKENTPAPVMEAPAPATQVTTPAAEETAKLHISPDGDKQTEISKHEDFVNFATNSHGRLFVKMLKNNERFSYEIFEKPDGPLVMPVDTMDNVHSDHKEFIYALQERAHRYGLRHVIDILAEWVHEFDASVLMKGAAVWWTGVGQCTIYYNDTNIPDGYADVQVFPGYPNLTSVKFIKQDNRLSSVIAIAEFVKSIKIR